MIVTYNRCNLLERCLDALIEQTCQDFDILILDNGSRDNTTEYLQERAKRCNSEVGYDRFIVVTVSENKGMANGFSVGFQSVFERGYDWVWTMDDDGVPEKYQLEELIKAAKDTGIYYLNSLVCDINEPKLLAFGIFKIANKFVAQQQQYIYDVVHPYNGTFIHRHIFEKCGNLKIELISYGMETEYVGRVKKNGFRVVTVTSALHYHFRKKTERIIPFIRKGRIYMDGTLWDHSNRVRIRNMGYIASLYGTARGTFLTMLGYSAYFLYRFRFKEFFLFHKIYISGLRGNL